MLVTWKIILVLATSVTSTAIDNFLWSNNASIISVRLPVPPSPLPLLLGQLGAVTFVCQNGVIGSLLYVLWVGSQDFHHPV